MWWKRCGQISRPMSESWKRLQRFMSEVKSPDLSELAEEVREIVKSELGI